jgi:LCP family protein required for cell wall assembly
VLSLDTDFDPAPDASERRRPRRRNRWLIALTAIAAVLLVAVGAGAVFAWNIARSFDEGTETIAENDVFPEESTRPDPLVGEAGEAQNILLLGSDSRGELSDDIGALDGGQRADTIMVAHIPAARDSVQVVSIMRDNWVSIPGHGEAKINAALSYGGVPLMVQTVEEFIGARIDHVAIIDFTGFKGLTDALGGVTIDNPVAFDSSHMPGTTFPAGRQHVNGEQALAFVRERYAFTDGDYQRARNQQVFIKAVLDKTLSAQTLTNPATLGSLVSTIAPYLTVDEGLNSSYLLDLGLGMTSVRGDDVRFVTSPTLGTGMRGSQSVVIVDEAKREFLREAFRTDTLAAYQP